MVRDYAISLKKSVKYKDSLSSSCFNEFLTRWSDLKIVKSQKLAMSRANSASNENLDSYFKELGTILTISDLKKITQKGFTMLIKLG